MGLKNQSEDPFAEDEENTDDGVADVESMPLEDDPSPQPETGEPEPSGESDGQFGYRDRLYVPLRDRVKAGRTHKPIYLHEETMDRERTFKQTIEAELGEDVPKADLREASYIVAMNNSDLVVEELRSWGFDYE